LIACYQVYEIIDALYSYRHYIEQKPDLAVFIYIDLESPASFTMKQGITIINFIIYLLEPVYPAIVIGITAALSVVILSIANLLYQFKKIMLRIREEGEDSETLKFIWTFSAHSSIFFCSQFVLNSFFLNFIFAFVMFIGVYIISFKETYKYGWHYIKGRDAEFWIGLVPVILG
jgi:hypothetical protein